MSKMNPADMNAADMSHACLVLAACFGLGSVAVGCKKPADEPPLPVASASAAAATPSPSAAQSQTAAAEPPKRYEVESGQVEYKQSGTLSGTETLFFKDFGRREMRDSKVKISLDKLANIPGANLAGLGGERHTITLIKTDTLISYDVNTKTGTRLSNTLDFFGGKQKLSGQNMTQLGLQMIQSLGGEKKGKKKVAGYDCDVWFVQKLNGNVCVYKGVSLEATVNTQGMSFHTEATKVDLKAKIPDDKFQVPPDVKLKEMDANALIQKGSQLGMGGQPAVASGSDPRPGKRLTAQDIKRLQDKLKQITAKDKQAKDKQK